MLDANELQILLNLSRPVRNITGDLYQKLEKMLEHAESKCLYYYTLTFQTTSDLGMIRAGTVTMGYEEKDKITIADLNSVKRTLGFPQDSVILNISYMGCFTAEQVKGTA